MDRSRSGGSVRKDVAGRVVTPLSSPKSRASHFKKSSPDKQKISVNTSEASSSDSTSSSEVSEDDDTEDDETDGMIAEEEDDEEEPWMTWFLRLPGHHLYVTVPEAFLRDDFHMTDLANKVPFYKAALALLLNDPLPSLPSDVTLAQVRASAKLLFTHVHARFITSKDGLLLLGERYQTQFYGTCPRYYCHRYGVLPVGLSDIPSQARVQVYCAACNDVYQLPPLYHRVDGAAFGTSLPHLFFTTFPHYLNRQNTPPPNGPSPLVRQEDGMKLLGEPHFNLPPLVIYTPKIFGFALHRRRLPNIDDAPGSSLRRFESFSLYQPHQQSIQPNSSTIAPPPPTHSKFGLPLSFYRNYIPNPLDMSWLRSKPNPYRSPACRCL